MAKKSSWGWVGLGLGAISAVASVAALVWARRSLASAKGPGSARLSAAGQQVTVRGMVDIASYVDAELVGPPPAPGAWLLIASDDPQDFIWVDDATGAEVSIGSWIDVVGTLVPAGEGETFLTDVVSVTSVEV